MNRFFLSLVTGLCLLAACSPSPSPVSRDAAARRLEPDLVVMIPDKGPSAFVVAADTNTLAFGAQAGCTAAVKRSENLPITCGRIASFT